MSVLLYIQDNMHIVSNELFLFFLYNVYTLKALVLLRKQTW